MTPRVTVLMPVYNGMSYLKEAIESVLTQSFKDFEFLIIDDGSADASVVCVESYKDSRIRFVRNEKNMGQARTLNRGLELARGEYIARLDQDDVCLPERLAEQVWLLDTCSDVAVVSTWEHSIDAQGRRLRSWSREIKNFGEFLGTLLLGKCPVWHPSSMFRRGVVESLGNYDPSYAPAEDYDLWKRIALARYRGAFVPKFLVLQRVHDQRQSVTKEAVQHTNAVRSHDALIARYCVSSDAAPLLASLLRRDNDLWTRCSSKESLKILLVALSNMLKKITNEFHMTTEEEKALKRIVMRQLGIGAHIGQRVLWLPSFFFLPLFFCLSPQLRPEIRRPLGSIYRTMMTLRYPFRLLTRCLQRRG